LQNYHSFQRDLLEKEHTRYILSIYHLQVKNREVHKQKPNKKGLRKKKTINSTFEEEEKFTKHINFHNL